MKIFNYKKIILLADIHFGVHVNSLDWLESQLEYFNVFFLPLITKEEKENPGECCVFVLGDIYDNRQFINVRIMNEVVRMFEKISSIMPVHILLGNHDVFYVSNNEVSSTISLERIPNITIWDKPEVVKYNNTKVLIMPWIKDLSEIKKCLTDNVADYVFCHTDVNNMRLNRSKKVDYGHDATVFSKYKKVYSGHIHIRQKYQNITMVGNNQHTKRSDIGDVKGIYILDLENDTELFVENKISPRYVEFQISELQHLDVKEIEALCLNNYVDVQIQHKEIVNDPIKINQLLITISKYAIILNTQIVYNNKIEETTEINLSFDVIDIIEQTILKMDGYSDTFKQRAINDVKEIKKQLEEENKHVH